MEARPGPITDHLHDSHEERFDADCSLCQEALDEAAAEHAWMGRAVKANPVNPYAPARDWYIDEEGWVKADA